MKSRLNNYSGANGRHIVCQAGERRARTRGVALIITLILLLLLSAASVAIVLLVSSDTMINGFYRNYRGSFYAADSGVNVVVETISNSLLNAGTSTANPPLPIGATTIPTVQEVFANAVNASNSPVYPTGLTTSFTSFTNGYFKMGDAGSWKGQFKMITPDGVTNPDGNLILGTPQFELKPDPGDSASCLPVTQATCVNATYPGGIANDHNYKWQFNYPYEVTVQGQSSGSEGEEVVETGTIVYTSTTGTAAGGPPPIFSKWAAFITNFAACQGPLVPGTMTGPFFTDGQWNFGNFNNPGYTFTGSIAQQNTQASWISNGGCTNSATAPSGFKQPSFPAGGLQLGAKSIVPPSDTYNQAQAVLDAKGIPPCVAAPCPTDPAPSQIVMNQELQTLSGTKYAASGSPSNGVYIPFYTSGTDPNGHTCTATHPCYGSSTANGGDGYAGGFYVQGNASITLIASTGGDSTSNATQTYQITQHSTTTTIVVDNTNNTTTVSVNGGSAVTMYGTPTQLNPNDSTPTPMPTYDPSGAVVNPTLIYVNGSVTGLTGNYDSHNNPLGAIQNDTGITIASSGSVSITGDIEYATLPVSIPSDASVSGTNAGVFGVYTNGNINLYPDPSGNLTVDGSLVALSGSLTGTSGFETPGNSINNWTIVGGRAEDQAHAVSIGSGNTYYDTRFGANFGPPFFPTAVPQPGVPSIPSSQQVAVNRGAWSELNRK